MDDSTKIFDRALLLFAAMGALVALMAFVVVLTGGDDVQPASAESSTTLDFDLNEFAVLGPTEVRPGQFSFKVHNTGSGVHNLALEGGPKTSDLGSGQMEALEVGSLGPGEYVIFCDIPGHREAGMEATLVVADDASPSAETGHDSMSGDEMNQMMIDSMLAFPAETDGLGNQPLEPVDVLADGTKVFELTAEVIDWEVEPGRIVDAWAYNGQVPGPWIRVDVGDRLEIRFTNLTPLGSDIHWHGIPTPNAMDGVAPYTQPPVLTGESFTYAFTADRAAIGMYHAHFHSQISVPNGMFGTIMIGETPVPAGATVSGIDIPEDLEVAREIPMVLNDAGVIGFSLNGKSFPATEPYVVQEGDWLVYHYYNEGLQSHPMHQHQFPQLVFAKDGIALDVPYWADTINIAPGERYSVLVHADLAGTWVWHCHILNHVEQETGMFGMVTALVVEERP